MTRHRWLWAMALLTGCGSRAQAGLANVPDENRAWGDEDRRKDAIANGQRSCPRAGHQQDDPLFARRPPCAEATPAASSVRPSPASAPR